jgi:hypothetical protein
MLLINVLLIYIGKILLRMPIFTVITIKGMTLQNDNQQNACRNLRNRITLTRLMFKKLHSVE